MSKITRSEFLKACTLGACSCAAAAVVPASALAQSTPSSNPEVDWLKQRAEKVKTRYAKMVSLLDENVDEKTRKKIFDGQGRECAHLTSDTTYDKFKGDLKAFLKEATGPDGWMESADYDEKAGTLRVVDRYDCTCPLVKKGLTSGSHCECTLGWQRETYSKFLGKPVEAELEESILRGGKKCIFRMKVVG